jgi:hypothetical protein
MEEEKKRLTVADWIFSVEGRWRKWVLVKTVVSFVAFYFRFFAVLIHVFIGNTLFLVPPDYTWKYWPYILDFGIFPIMIMLPIILADLLSWRNLGYLIRKEHKAYRPAKGIGISVMMWLVAIIDFVILLFDIYLIVNYSAYAFAVYGVFVGGLRVYWGWTVGILVGTICFLDLVVCRFLFILYTLALWTYGTLRAVKAFDEWTHHNLTLDDMMNIVVSTKPKRSQFKYNKMTGISDNENTLL